MVEAVLWGGWGRERRGGEQAPELSLPLTVIRSAADCLEQVLSGSGAPGTQGPELSGFPGSHSAVVCCPANPTLHIPLLDRSRKKVTMQGPMCFSFQADGALLDA